MRNIYFMFCLLLFSCKTLPENAIILTEFPEVRYLEGDTVNYFDSELGIMSFHDAGKYIICGSHRTDYHFAVYEKNTFNKAAELFKAGRGPGEFIAPIYWSQYTVEDNHVKIWVLERALSKYMKVDLDKSIHCDSVCIDEQYILPQFTRLSFRDVFFLQDSFLFATEDNQDCKHVFLDLKTKHVSFVEHTLEFPDNFNPHGFSQSLSVKHPEQMRMASVFYNFPQIDFIQKGKIYRTVFYERMISPRQVDNNQQDDNFFSGICSDSKYVYALYNRDSLSSEEIKNESSVFVFTWQGEPVSEYKISYASYVFVDSESRLLYALNPRKEYYNTTIYRLP